MDKPDLYHEISVNDNFVRHVGKISKIINGVITVSLIGNFQCEACNAKRGCGISDSELKEIEVIDTYSKFSINESVEVILAKELGLKAVLWAYVIPFILLLSVLIITSYFLKEWIAGILSLLILIPYYFILYILRRSFKKKYKFSILKYNQI